MSEIKIFTDKIPFSEIKRLADLRFGDMVKGVVDIENGKIALGGELHADEEAELLNEGSEQENLWGINIYPDIKFPDNIEFDSMINIRPRQNNRSRAIESEEVKNKILEILKDRIVYE
ncbi:MAG: DUF5674 family protein [Candidatus Magasanikbacteria bacterium]|jgi:hypothetical protein